MVFHPTSKGLPMRIALCLLPLILSAGVELSAEISEMEQVKLRPCLYVATDLGESPRERNANARKFAKHIAETSSFFLKAFDLKPKSFVHYAEFYHREPDSPWDQWIRIRIFRRYQEFLDDFQKRYESKAIPGAFFGIIRNKDEYGEYTGPWFREIATHAEGISDEQILRHLYHEMGHLFMRTYMLYPCEVPSWIEEGTAELFQYRKGNGTDPMPTRIERLGWLRELVDIGESEIGASVPWKDFTEVRNAHNLAFTHQDPLRSTVQYVQAWSVMEFMVSDRRRGAAFSKLLELIKKEAQNANQVAGQRGLSGQAYRKFITDQIYRQQYKLFTEAYGADVLKVEKLWKEWVREDYEEKLAEHPELRYHRGEWQLEKRAQFAKSADERHASWQELIEDVKGEVWREKQLNDVIRELRRQGKIVARGAARFAKTNNPELLVVEES